ncbi:MAG: hypothetical protein ACXWCT_15130, partial [Flavitalea sp.]
MQILSSFNWRRILITVLCLLVYLIAIAQYKKRIDVTHSQSIEVVSSDKLQEFRVGNLTDVLRFDPKTHQLKSRTVTYDFPTGPIDKKIQMVQYDQRNQPAYTLVKTFDQSGSVITALEELRVNGDILKGQQWFGDRKQAFLYNDARDRYETTTFNAQWQPAFVYTPPAITEINWQPNVALNQLINDIRIASPGQFTVADKTYSPDGKAEVSYSSGADMKVSEKKIYDARGVVREYHYRETYPDDYMYEEITYFDCEGIPVYFESTMYDDNDYEYKAIRMQFRNGQPEAGYYQVDDYDGEFRQYYNPGTGQFEYLPGDDAAYMNYMFDMEEQFDPCDQPNHLFSFGPRIILEDSYPERFTTIGGYLQYTYMFNDKIGGTVDLGYTTGKQFDWQYNKLNILGGATYFPFDCLGLEDDFSLSVHALAGLSSLKG